MSLAIEKSGRGTTDTWLTPPSLLYRLGSFDLDPCACPEPRPWATATKMISLPEDGLGAPWNGSVWLNPPYGPRAGRWLLKLSLHQSGGVALIFARTETKWFHDYVWRKAQAVLFLKGRLVFCNRHGKPGDFSAAAPSCLVAYGVESVSRIQSLQDMGAFVRLK